MEKHAVYIYSPEAGAGDVKNRNNFTTIKHLAIDNLVLLEHIFCSPCKCVWTL